MSRKCPQDQSSRIAERPLVNLTRKSVVLFASIALSIVALTWEQLHTSPDRYTVCSKSKNIYTVDESNPRVECISVRGSRIVDTGSFRMSDIACLGV
jgi:hypothetical protein